MNHPFGGWFMIFYAVFFIPRSARVMPARNFGILKTTIFILKLLPRL